MNKKLERRSIEMPDTSRVVESFERDRGSAVRTFVQTVPYTLPIKPTSDKKTSTNTTSYEISN